MTKEFKLLPVIPPNFIPVEIFKEKIHVAVESLTPTEAEQYGELLKQSFLDHYNKKKTR